MLFIVDGEGVPSVARFIRLEMSSSTTLSLSANGLIRLVQRSLKSTIAMPAKATAWETLTKNNAWEKIAKDSVCRFRGTGINPFD